MTRKIEHPTYMFSEAQRVLPFSLAPLPGSDSGPQLLQTLVGSSVRGILC